MGIADGGLRAEFKKHLVKPDWWWTSIETRGTRNGVPDTFYVNRPIQSHGWIECKKTDGWAVKFEPMQVSWLDVHATARVPCFVAVRVSGQGSSGGEGDGLWLCHASGVKTLEDQGLPKVSMPWWVLGVWLGPPKQWDWSEISKILSRS